MRPPCTRQALFLILSLMLVMGCAAGSGSGSGGSSRDAVTQEELAGYQNTDVHQALRSLRPNWLTYRGGAPQVLLNGLRRGGVDSLRQILVQDVGTIRFLSPREATNQHGTGFPYGAISIETR